MFWLGDKVFRHEVLECLQLTLKCGSEKLCV